MINYFCQKQNIKSFLYFIMSLKKYIFINDILNKD